MNRRFKLFFSLVSLCFSIAMLCFGVYSAMSVNYSVNGTVSYELDRAYVNISTKLYLSKEGLINQSKLNTKINEIYEEISTNGTDNSDFDSLSVVESTQYQDEPYLSVDDNGAINQDTSPTSGEMNINYGSFSQTSTDESAYSYYIVVELENIGSNNAYVKLDSSSLQAENSIVKSNTELLSLDGKVDETDVDYFVIGMALDDPTTSIGENTFNFIIEVSDEQPTFEPISNAIYTLNSDTNEAVLTSYTGSEEEVIIPETIAVVQSAIKEETYSEDDIVSMMSSDMGMIKAFRYVKITESEKAVSTFQMSSEQQEPVLFYDWIMSKVQIDESSGEQSFPSVSFPITVEYCDTIINSLPEEVTNEQELMVALYPLMMPIMMLEFGYIDDFTLEIGVGETYATAVIDYAYIESLFTSSEPDTTNPIYNYFYTIMSSSSGMPDISSLKQFLPIKYTNIMTTNIYSGGTIGEQYKVTAIEENAFRDCTTLTSVTIPSGVTSIGNSAFSGCDNLTTVMFEDNSQLQSIGNSAFSGCDNLTTVMFGGNSQLQSIGDAAFSSCSTLTSITIPEGVTSIGRAAFEDCSSLTSITIPEGVTSIGDSVFYGCDSLTSITIPDSVTSIGSFVFSGCDSLTSITIPDSVTSIRDDAFSGCHFTRVTYSTSGEGYTFKNGTLTIQGEVPDSPAWYEANINPLITKVVFEGSTTSIGRYAFEDCSSLTSITIPEGVTSIGFSAFSGCYSLTSITIPDSVTSIGSFAFSRCHFTSVTYSTSGEGYTFKNGTLTIKGVVRDRPAWYKANINPLVTKVVFEGSTTSIGRYAFSGCSSLTSITIPEGVTSIGDSVFSGCDSLTSITIPDSVTSIGSLEFSDCHFTSVTYSTSGEGYTFKNGTLTIQGEVSDSPAWYEANINQLITKVVFEGSITSIGDFAFYNCSSLTSIIIPESVTSIGNSAFGYCDNLITIEFGANSQLQSIGDDTFEYCSSLTSITIPDSVTSIGSNAFLGCDNLNTVYIDSQDIVDDLLYSYSEGYLISYLQSGTGCVYVKDTLTIAESCYLNQGDFQIVPSSVEGYICYRKK